MCLNTLLAEVSFQHVFNVYKVFDIDDINFTSVLFANNFILIHLLLVLDVVSLNSC